MNKFIWVRDREKKQHYVNIDSIVRVTKVPPHGHYITFSYIMLSDKTTIDLSNDEYDTYEEVIEKINQVQA